MHPVVDRPHFWILLIFGCLVILLPFAGKHEIDNKLEENVLQGPELITYNNFVRRFGNDRMLLAAFNYKALDAELIRALFQLEDKLLKTEGVSEVISPVTTLRKVFRLNSGAELDNWLSSTSRIDNYFTRIGDFSVLKNVILNPDQKMAGVVIGLKPWVSDTDGPTIAAITASAMEQPFFNEKLTVTGIPDIVRVLQDYTEHSRRVFTPATLLVIILVLTLLYPSAGGVLIPLATILAPLIATMGIYNMMGNSTNFITAMIPPLILGLGLTSCIHVITSYIILAGDRREFDRELLIKVLKDQTPPIMMCQITTIFGFGTLATNGLGAIRQYGIYSALGVGIVILSVLALLPSLMTITGFRSPGSRYLHFSHRIFTSLAQYVTNHSRKILLLSLFALFLGISGISRLTMETSLIRYLPRNHPVTKKIGTIEEGLCGIVPIHLTLSRKVKSIDTGSASPRDLYDPEICRAISRLQDEILRIPGVGSAISYVNLVTDYDRAFSGEPDNIPPTREEVLDYLDFYRPMIEPVYSEEVVRNPDGSTAEILIHETIPERDKNDSTDLVNTFITSDGDQAHITVRIRDVSSRELSAIFARIRSLATDLLPPEINFSLTGRAYLWATASEVLVRNEAENFLLSLLLIDLVIIWRFRSLVVGLAALLPNLLPLFLIYGFMGFAGIAVNTVTGILACVAIGMSVDDTIHFTHAMSRWFKSGVTYEEALKRSLLEKGWSMIFTTLVIMSGFGVLMLSPFQPTFQFGLLICLTFIMALVLDLTLTPAILLLAKPFGSEPCDNIE